MVVGDAQSPEAAEKPVWTLEIIQVRPEKFSLAMGYLEEHWVPLRVEAKHRGAVLSYHRFSNAGLVTPNHRVLDENSIVLLTEYKNMDAFTESQRVFEAMRERINWQTGGVVEPRALEDLVERLNTEVFVEAPPAAWTRETSKGFKVLTKQ
jgi:hypothetical protein